MPQLKIALRRLRRQPTFSLAAIAVLAIGIAAPTALFAVVHATLLRPLPYARADEIYTVRTTMTDGRFTIGLVASAEMNALRRTTNLVVQSALIRRSDVTLTTDGGTRQIAGYAVSVGFFELFGVPMAAGRSFNEDDLTSWVGSRVILSHRAWHTYFGGDPGIVGRTIRLFDGPGSLVVGIAPAAFSMPSDAELWVAMQIDDSIGHMYDAYVRLAPGATPDVLQPRLGGMWADLAQQYPDQAKNRVFVLRPLLHAIVGDLGPIVVIAFAATGLVLLLAIVNVANLLVARGTTRIREVAVRSALGATRRHLWAQLAAEAVILAGAATAIGLTLAYAATRTLVALGGDALPRGDGLRIDVPVFLFAVALMIASGVIVAIVPLLAIGPRQLIGVMNEGGRAGLQGRSTRRLLAGMIVAEVALAVALAGGAGRLLLSMNNLLHVDPGFSADGRLAIDVQLPVRPYLVEPARVPAWLEEAQARLRGLGATAVGVASSLPLRRELDSTTFVDIRGWPTEPSSRPNGRLRVVDAGFFDVLRVPVVAGRSFTADDRYESEPVVLVNEAWARKFLGDLDPLRERVNPGAFARRVDGKFVTRDAAIVGVVRDLRYAGLAAPVEPVVYVSAAQVIRHQFALVIATSDGQPQLLASRIRAALQEIDPRVAVDFEPLSEALSASLTWPKVGVLLMTTFGLAGLVLAATGVFGVVAFVTAQRAGELAVRAALGATRGSMFRLVILHAGTLAVAGLAIGVAIAWWMGAPMAAYVYGVAPANPLVLGGSAAVVFAVALAAALPSARRAAATDPARVLRS